MAQRFRPPANPKNRATTRHNGVVRSRIQKRTWPVGKRARGLGSHHQQPFVPPEDWYEPGENDSTQYAIIVQDPGPGFRHVIAPQQIRQRLAQLPEEMLRPLKVVQLSRMTKKKQLFPCYGMQWGATVYLYPLEENLIECFHRPPKPEQFREAKMFGARWLQRSQHCWDLIWSEAAIQDFYLNNVLIHELGHLLDDRNTSYVDRERFAEAFAIRWGYQPTRTEQLAGSQAVKVVRRRHHAK